MVDGGAVITMLEVVRLPPPASAVGHHRTGDVNLFISEPLLHQQIFDPVEMVALKFDPSVLRRPPGGDFAFQFFGQPCQVNLLIIDTINDSDAFSPLPCVNEDAYSSLDLTGNC